MINVVKALEIFLRLKKRNEHFAFLQLVEFYDYQKASWLRDSICGTHSAHIGYWHPAQFHWALKNIPELKDIILQLSKELKLDYTVFQQSEFPYTKEDVASLIAIWNER